MTSKDFHCPQRNGDIGVAGYHTIKEGVLHTPHKGKLCNPSKSELTAKYSAIHQKVPQSKMMQYSQLKIIFLVSWQAHLSYYQ